MTQAQAGRLPRAAWAAAALVLGLLSGCDHKATQANQPPVAIHADDTSATCGMYITRYPGPRGEAYVMGTRKPFKFGSTRDTFSFVTRPDVSHRLEAVYVQETAGLDWAHPSNAAASFINARKAFYVAWQPRLGDMGPTFASFARRSDAQAFMRRYGGALLTYRQITPELVSQLSTSCPAPGSPLSEMADTVGCVTVRSPHLRGASTTRADKRPLGG